MISVVVPDKLVKKVVSTIIEVNKTGKAGDGKIFVLPVDESIRIRTGETGDETLDEADRYARVRMPSLASVQGSRIEADWMPDTACANPQVGHRAPA